MKEEMVAKTEEIPKWRVSIIGVIVAILIIFIGIKGISDECKRGPLDREMNNRIVFGAPGYYTGFLNSLIVGTPQEKSVPHAEAVYTLMQMSTAVPIFVIGVCLLIRSFLSGIGFKRIVLTVLGGYLIGLVLFPVIGVIIRVGRPNLDVAAIHFIMTIPGIILVMYGLQPKNGFPNDEGEDIILSKDEQPKKGDNEKKYEPTVRKLKIICPKCGRSLKGATNEMIGDTGVCPKCKAEFVIEQKQ